jgi:hypothetical protein
MKATIYSIAVPILAAVGFAQDTPPAQPKQPTETAAPATQSDKTTSQSADRLQEVKTQTYSGTLVDASCAGTGSTAAASCALSGTATQFALQMKDGQTVRFDDVGNTRAQDAMKARKKWADSAAANKPIRVKVGGLMSGDKLTVVSID